MVSGIKSSIRNAPSSVRFVSFLSDLGTCITSIPISLCGKKQKQAIAISIIEIICKVSSPKKLTFENPNISMSVIKDNDVSAKSKAPVIVEDDVGKVADRSCFAGSTATTDRLYRTMADAIGRDMVALSKMASLTPARIMGFTDRGELAVGKRADIVILDDALVLQKVILCGEAV